ncbi:hypothetical protein NA57DRAFT_30955 [Rhizodiscina lignyota]|uniref:Uncharacterized protein n=1 Tax=Rhizodiscina lignyota TaxID=1504668 RepID=A0A9P4MGN8_9PEZI|nr:hypothetical protein NA57DRAFT_30955 [Rhizodiscina lignyota]
MPPPTGNTFPHTSLPVIPSVSEPHILPVHLSRNSRVDVELGNAHELAELPTPHSPVSPRTPRLSSGHRRNSRTSLEPHRPEAGEAENEKLLPPDEFDSDLSDDPDGPSSSSSHQMGKKGRPNGIKTSIDASEQNGHATGSMERPLEHRRKHAVLDSPTSASQTAHLMSRESFTLDDPVPRMSHDHEPVSRGFTELPEKDRRNFLMLVLLYFLQGLPMGLASGSVPFLLKQHVSYGQIGVFSLAIYPYSLKLLWSPIVDAVWSRKIGRRKSWILPVQTLSGIGMLWLASRVEGMINAAGEDDGAGVWGFTWWWFGLVFTCATQDIAVDAGWALTLLSHENLSYASTAQTVGLTAGQFLSSTVFLAFNSKDFANRWFRTEPLDYGLVTLGGALAASGWLYLVVTLGLGFLKREELTKNTEGVWDVYKVMGGILKLRNIQSIIIVHLIAKIGFQANDAATFLKLLDKGFTQDDLALTVLIDFPFEIGLGYYVGKWSATYPPMQLWCWAFVGRLIAAGIAQLVVMLFPSGGVNTGYLIAVICGHVFSTFMGTVMFVAASAFHAKIADPVIGGTYMTLLATVSNLGGTFPRFFVLKFIDMFTVATCVPPETAPSELKGDLITAPFSCVLEAEKHRCRDGGGTCSITRDGFYIVNILCIIIGVLTFWGYIKPAVLKLQGLPLRAWRLSEE